MTVGSEREHEVCVWKVESRWLRLLTQRAKGGKQTLAKVGNLRGSRGSGAGRGAYQIRLWMTEFWMKRRSFTVGTGKPKPREQKCSGRSALRGATWRGCSRDRLNDERTMGSARA